MTRVTAAFFLPLQHGASMHMEAVPTTGTIRQHLLTNSAYPALIGQAVGASQAQPFFHWPLEFPDVFEHGGFDAVLSNPPFVGGKRISTSLGDRYRKHIKCVYFPAEGLTDLCAFFYRCAYRVLRTDGHLGMVATNTIGQRDTREGGLAVILKNGGAINFRCLDIGGFGVVLEWCTVIRRMSEKPRTGEHAQSYWRPNSGPGNAPQK